MFQSLIIRLKNFFLPQPPLLGRWCSTVVKDQEQKKIWFHDSCTQDNCYLKIKIIDDKNLNE